MDDQRQFEKVERPAAKTQFFAIYIPNQFSGDVVHIYTGI